MKGSLTSSRCFGPKSLACWLCENAGARATRMMQCTVSFLVGCFGESRKHRQSREEKWSMQTLRLRPHYFDQRPQTRGLVVFLYRTKNVQPRTAIACLETAPMTAPLTNSWAAEGSGFGHCKSSTFMHLSQQAEFLNSIFCPGASDSHKQMHGTAL